MSSTLKMVIGVGAALLIGLLVGYVLGSSGRSSLEKELHKAKSLAADSESSLKQEEEACESRHRKARTGKYLMEIKVHLLRAIIELSSSNYGLASQHLGKTRKLLKVAMKGLKKHHRKKAKELFEKLGNAQTLAMRLDPMARVLIDQILGEIQKLQGA